MTGRVVSVKMKNSAVVLVSSRKTHPLYKKTFLRTKKYLVDDPLGVQEGAIVEFVKTRPISKRKHWRIIKILGTDVVALGTQTLKEKATEAIEEVLPEKKEKVELEVKKTEEVKMEKPKRKRREK